MHVIEILGMMAGIAAIGLAAVRAEQVRRQPVPVRIKRDRR